MGQALILYGGTTGGELHFTLVQATASTRQDCL